MKKLSGVRLWAYLLQSPHSVVFLSNKILRIVASLVFLVCCTSLPLQAKLGISFQTGLGRPTDAAVDASRRTDYLIERSQFVLSYNDNTRQANWVGWSLSNVDRGITDRTDAWSVETLLPSGYLRVGTATFGTGWDRGHMAPSADRTLSYNDNAATFVMSNIVPQASRNNQGLWADFENYCRLTLSADGSEVLIISGPSEFGGTMLSNGMAIPSSVWKIVVKVPAGNGTAAQRVSQSTRVIALLTPNLNLDTLGSWQGYITSVEEIEVVTGFRFFRDIEAVNPGLATYLKNVVDTGTGPNLPTVITSFSPTSAAPGSPVTISGYNFGTSAAVLFNGLSSPATVLQNGTQISTTVPSGATTGEITVTTSNSTDISAQKFTVLTTSAASISLSTTSISEFSASQGTPGLSKTYTLSGSNLGGPVTLTAPAGFELSLNNTVFSGSLNVTPSGGMLANVPVYVRLASTAPLGPLEGQIVHSATGAASVVLAVSGEVRSSLPTISISQTSLSGFSAVFGFAGNAKTYTLSGYNLTGGVTVAAPANFEVSADGTTFGSQAVFIPSNGELASVPVRARLSANAPQGFHSGNITHSGGGASQKTLEVSGSVGTAEGGETAEVYWNFNTAAPSSNQTVTFTVGELSRGNNFGNTTQISATSPSSGYSGFSGGNNSAATARIGPLNTGGNGSAYFEFTVSPSPGVNFELKGLSFGARSTSTGPKAYALRTSADNFSSSLIQGVSSNNSTWVLNSHSEVGFSSNSSITFRIYGFNGTGSPGSGNANWRIDDLKLNISTTVPVVSRSPVINSPDIASASAFSSFQYQITASNSPTSFAAVGLPDGLSCDPTTGLISGMPTNPGTYLVTLTASNASGDGSATLSLVVAKNQNAPVIIGTLSDTGQLRAPFEFQVEATNSPKAYLATGLPAGLTLDSSTGLVSGIPLAAGNFSVSLTVQNDFGSDSQILYFAISDPTLLLSLETLPAFSSTLGIPGTAAGYTLSGSQLPSDITLLAPPNFEISSGGGVYSESLILAPTNGSLSANLLVRLSANATLGAHEGSIIHSGGGAVPKYLAVSGNVTAPVPTLSLSSAALEPFSTTVNKTSIFQTYTVAGGGLSGNVTIQAPAGFEIRPEGGNFTNSLSLAPTNGNLAQTSIEVRLAASLTGGTFAGDITHSASGVAVKKVSVTGTVETIAPPVISSSGSGAAYRGRSHSLQILTEGSTPVNGYGATGLPPGMTLNTATGIASGTPSSNGTFQLVLSASGDGGTSTANYTLVVREQNADLSNPLNVVVNKYINDGTADVVELLVAANGVRGATVDLRGMVLKDFSSNMGADLGGKFLFTNSPVWQSVKAGTLIVLSSTNSTEDFAGGDFILRANLSNPDLFKVVSGGFNLGAIEMVMVKAAGMGADGFAGGMHVLSVGTTGTQYSNFNGRKLNSSRSLSSSRPYAFTINDNSSLPDFYANSGADAARNLVFGSGSNAKNTTFITSLRSTSNTPPTISLNGTNPMTIAHGTVYNEPGATAYDSEDGTRPVTISGTVNPWIVGNYTVTYRASDSGNLTTTVNRTVLVRDQTPPVVTLNGNATIEIPFGGNFTDPGATANDAVNGNRTVNVSGTVNRFAAGSYILTYTATDTAGNTSPGVTRTVRVAKGVPVISQAPSASPITYGSLLSDSTLSGGSASVAGNFSWTHPSTIPPIGTGNFSVTFTASDSGNYTTATALAVLTVNPATTAFGSWAAAQGLTGLDAAMTADPDFDGFDNAKEFAFGLDPKSAGSKPLEISKDENGRVKVTFLKRNGITYTVRIASDLAIGFNGTLQSSPSADESNLPEGYTRHEALLPSQDKAFIKIEATIP